MSGVCCHALADKKDVDGRDKPGHDAAFWKLRSSIAAPSLNTLHRKWIKDPAFRKEYEALDVEFMLIAEVSKALSGQA